MNNGGNRLPLARSSVTGDLFLGARDDSGQQNKTLLRIDGYRGVHDSQHLKGFVRVFEQRVL